MGAFYSLRLARRSPSICRNKMRNNVLRCQLEGEPLASRENGERPKSAKRDFCKRLSSHP